MWTNGYGFADVENRSPAKSESMYRMASVNKPMTALAILQLTKKGKIDLDAEVQTYVPYFPKKKFPVTVRQLLGHIAGISHYKDYDKEGHFKDRKNTREAIAVFEDFDLVNEPGTRYSYSTVTTCLVQSSKQRPACRTASICRWVRCSTEEGVRRCRRLPCGPMIAALEQHVRQGSLDKAMKFADLSVEPYPGLDRTHAYKGLLLLVLGEREKGKQALMHSIELNRSGLASPGSLNNSAHNLERLGKRDAGIELLNTAIELYPKDANVHDSLAEFYAKKDMKNKAIEYHQKALAIDAGYPNAVKAKQLLQKLIGGND